jgi:hypothetical protein
MYNQSKMSVNAIINASNLDINKVSFGDIRVSKTNGSKSVPIKYNGQNFQIRIPRIFYPAGVVTRTDDQGKSSYSLLASLKGCDTYVKDRAGPDAGEIGQLYNFMLDLQEKIIQHAVLNGGKWFGKSKSEAVLRETMKPILNPSVEKVNGEWVPSGKYPPSLRMKISVWDGAVSLDAMDPNGESIAVTLDNIEQVFAKRMEGRMVIAPSIYVTGTGFGVTWRVVLAKIFPPSRVSAKAAFADIKEPEDDGPGEELDGEDSVQVPVAEPEEEERAPPPQMNRANTGGAGPAPVPAAKPGRKRAAVAAAQ